MPAAARYWFITGRLTEIFFYGGETHNIFVHRHLARSGQRLLEHRHGNRRSPSRGCIVRARGYFVPQFTPHHGFAGENGRERLIHHAYHRFNRIPDTGLAHQFHGATDPIMTSPKPIGHRPTGCLTLASFLRVRINHVIDQMRRCLEFDENFTCFPHGVTKVVARFWFSFTSMGRATGYQTSRCYQFTLFLGRPDDDSARSSKELIVAHGPF